VGESGVITNNMEYYLSTRDINAKFRSPEYELLAREEVRLLRSALSRKPLTILDIGSYDGRIGFVITDILNYQPQELYLTDFNDTFLKKCKDNIKAHETYIKVKKADAKKLPFPKSSFDLVLALGDTFCLIDRHDYHPSGRKVNNDPLNTFKIALKQGVSMLKSGGELIFSVDPEYVPDHKSVLSDVTSNFLNKELTLDLKDVQVQDSHRLRHLISLRILKNSEEDFYK